jgi:hypothetical protein
MVSPLVPNARRLRALPRDPNHGGDASGRRHPAAFAIPNIGEAVWRGRAMVKKLRLPVAIVTGAGLAMAGTLSLSARSGLESGSAPIRIVSVGIDASVATPSPTASIASAPEPCTALTNSAGSTEPAPGTTKCGLPSRVTLQDRVWFGAYWQLLATPIILGGGYVNARVERTSDGNFFDGIVDKVDGNGHSRLRGRAGARRRSG